jgi:uncharacterized repeat protein (TIGR03803 family)
MRSKKISIGFVVLLAIFVVPTIMTATLVAAQTETVLYNSDGNPLAGVIFDAEGNLYGTTSDGGTNKGGTVFELVRKTGWTLKVLHVFGPDVIGNKDGYFPRAGLIFDAAGNLYGTTEGGGAYSRGTAFELTKMCGGWTEKILHNFGSGKDGTIPISSLIFDAAGNLYGTTASGGVYINALHPLGGGTVFELSPTTDGVWAEKILHSFGSSGDGAGSYGVILDAQGNLYGTTSSGGKSTTCPAGNGCGIVFELSPDASGNWTEEVLHYFSGPDGMFSVAGLIFDTAGNLYGTTELGGKNENDKKSGCPTSPESGCGVVFELSPAAGGGWTEKTVYYFGGNGYGPRAGVILDASGNLYGTTSNSSECGGCGNAFELKPSADGGWDEAVLYSLGGLPSCGLIFDDDGNLYGTTSTGGTNAGGTVFEITP